MPLSHQQQLTLAITPKCTATLSIASSSFIIYEACCDMRRGKTNAIQRALVGMSIIDVLASFAWWLSTWAEPVGSVPLATGNQVSCDFQGFLLQLAIGAPLYNCSLALYYLLVIKYNWSNEMLRRIEIWTHVTILSFSIGTSIALLPLQQYNPIGTVCWVIGSPPECGHSSYQSSDIECDRGNNAYLYGLALFYGPLWMCVLACISSMAVIYCEVRKTHRRLRRYSLPSGDSDSPDRKHPEQKQQHSLRRSAADTSSVATQAILYSLSFFVTWTPSTIWSVAHWFNVESFWLDFLSALCEPLQGFWNCLIFLRKRPKSRRKLRHLIRSVMPCCLKSRSNGGGAGGGVTTDDDPTHSGHFLSRNGRRSSSSHGNNSGHGGHRKHSRNLHSHSSSHHSHNAVLNANLEKDPDAAARGAPWETYQEPLDQYPKEVARGMRKCCSLTSLSHVKPFRRRRSSWNARVRFAVASDDYDLVSSTRRVSTLAKEDVSLENDEEVQEVVDLDDVVPPVFSLACRPNMSDASSNSSSGELDDLDLAEETLTRLDSRLDSFPSLPSHSRELLPILVSELPAKDEATVDSPIGAEPKVSPILDQREVDPV